MKAKLISAGAIYLTGIIEEPLQSYLAGRLAELGIDLTCRMIVGDDLEDLAPVLTAAAAEKQLLLLTGCGLAAYEQIRSLIKEAGEEMTLAIPGSTSRAEGHILQYEGGVLACLYGNEDEVKELFEDELVGFLLKETAQGQADAVMALTGAFEKGSREVLAALDQKLAPVLVSDNPAVRIEADEDAVRICIHAVGPGRKDAQFLAQMMAGDISRRLGNENVNSIKILEEETC